MSITGHYTDGAYYRVVPGWGRDSEGIFRCAALFGFQRFRTLCERGISVLVFIIVIRAQCTPGRVGSQEPIPYRVLPLPAYTVIHTDRESGTEPEQWLQFV